LATKLSNVPLTTITNFSAYLFLVTTPGKHTGWIGLSTKRTNSIIIALKSLQTQTKLVGPTPSDGFIHTDAGGTLNRASLLSHGLKLMQLIALILNSLVLAVFWFLQ
jgi:hypothetical protein